MRGAIGLIKSYDFLMNLLTVTFQSHSSNQESAKREVDYQLLIDQKLTSLMRSKNGEIANSFVDNGQ